VIPRTDLEAAPAPAPVVAPDPVGDVLDALLRVAGSVVAFVGGLVGAVAALLLVPLRLDWGSGAVRVPLAIVLAVAGNALLVWFARETTRSGWAVLLPAVGWFAVMLPALGSTDAGSRLLMPNDWVGLLTLFGGTITLTIGVVVALVAHRPPARR
jgi:hypothetical protein